MAALKASSASAGVGFLPTEHLLRGSQPQGHRRNAASHQPGIHNDAVLLFITA